MNKSFLNSMWREQGLLGRLTLGFVVLLLVWVPLANQLIPSGNALHVSSYTMTLLGKYLSFALLALSVDLVWGYLGILSLGHGAFFALGGYAMGMYLMRQIGSRGTYGDPILPDFMVFLNWKELPWFWLGFDHFAYALLMVFLVPGVLAFIVGWLCFRSRVSGVYFSIITQAVTYALLLAFYRNEMGFGGNNGMTDFKDILGYSLQADGTRCVLFIITALSVLGVYAFLHRLIGSRLGRLTVATRDAQMRLRFVGYRVEHVKLMIFVLSAVIAGWAGALYVPQVGIINPSEFSPINSIEIIVWVAVGGRATLFGGIIGALLINYAKSYFTATLPEAWLFVLGTLFVLVTLLLPNGIAGLLNLARKKNDTLTPAEVKS